LTFVFEEILEVEAEMERVPLFWQEKHLATIIINNLTLPLPFPQSALPLVGVVNLHLRMRCSTMVDTYLRRGVSIGLI
jgi:hypothetical protein